LWFLFRALLKSDDTKVIASSFVVAFIILSYVHTTKVMMQKDAHTVASETA